MQFVLEIFDQKSFSWCWDKLQRLSRPCVRITGYIAINNAEVKTTNHSIRFSTSLLMDSAWRRLQLLVSIVQGVVLLRQLCFTQAETSSHEIEQ